MVCRPLASVPGMVSSSDRRAAWVLLGLATLGLVVRWTLATNGAPGAVAYQAGAEVRAPMDSVAARAARLARPLGSDETIDVDRASAEELTRLPRVGPALARRIVEDRERRGPFGTLAALARVSGIGPSVLGAVKRHAVFSGRASDARTPRRAPIDLNSASVGELETLPGIGRVKAGAIVEDRTRHGRYRSLEDLLRVPGIGPATLERLRGRVRIS